MFLSKRSSALLSVFAALLLASSGGVSTAEEVVQLLLEAAQSSTAAPLAAPPTAGLTSGAASTSAPTASLPAPAEVGSVSLLVETSASGKSTLAPAAVSSTMAPQQLPAGVEQLIRMLSSEHANSTEPIHSFCDYLKPICGTLEKLTDKSIAKINSQLKKFVHLSDGKLNQCFADSYAYDPAKANLTRRELAAICGSKNLSAEVKGSYKAFQHCAEKHWSANIDKEIDRIQVARLEYLRANQHLKDSASGMLAQGDEEEAKTVSEVVDKVLGGEPGKSNTANEIKLVSVEPVAGQAKPTTMAPATLPPAPILQHAASSSPAPAAKAHTTQPGSSQTEKPLMSDPNTLLVFVDEAAKSTSTSARPETTTANLSKLSQSRPPEAKPVSKSTAAPKLGLESSNSEDALRVVAAAADSTTSTGKPQEAGSETVSKKHEEKSSKEESTTSKTTKIILEAASKSSSTKAPTSTLAPTTATSSTKRPIEEKLEAKASQLEKKLKEEREMMLKLLKKNQDELEAINAMRILSAQRQKVVAQHDHSDERVHQMEHNRQMAIDPIGHMIKHQQFDVKKKLSG